MKISHFIIISVFLLSSCKVFNGGGMSFRNSNKRSGIVRVSQYGSNGTMVWAHHDPTQRQTLMFVDENGNVRVLAEQSPDAGVTSTSNISGKANVFEKVEAETVLEFQANLEKLTNRTSGLMITRENLYAIRELFFNGGIDSSQAVILYREYLSKIIDIVKEDAKIEDTKLKYFEAEVEQERLALERMKLEKEDKGDDKKQSN